MDTLQKFFKENFIVIIFSLLMISSMLYLSKIESDQHDLNKGKDWWSLYFENPKDDSLNFTIENHGDIENFKWELFLEKNKTHESSVVIKKGEQKIFPISTEEINDRKIIIRVSNGSQIREIYKRL